MTYRVQLVPAVLEGKRGDAVAVAGERPDLAVGETVILLTPPSRSLLKYLLKGERGCSRITVSPTAIPTSSFDRLSHNRSILSCPPAAVRLPSLVVATARTCAPWPCAWSEMQVWDTS